MVYFLYSGFLQMIYCVPEIVLFYASVLCKTHFSNRSNYFTALLLIETPKICLFRWIQATERNNADSVQFLSLTAREYKTLSWNDNLDYRLDFAI